MSKVSVNPPRTPVTEGSSGLAVATMPNVCKMPGPPAPFVPTPLPNIGKSGDRPKGYSKRVTMEGKAVAIRGASFGSTGDIASKATGGGLLSSNCEGPTKFIGPGSMNVQIEGKNVQLLGDPMLNNCGPSGSPPNSATMTGVIQMSGELALLYGDDAVCSNCQKTHTGIPATAGLRVAMNDVFKALKNALAGQRADIARLAQLRRADQTAQANALEAALEPRAVLRHDANTLTFSRGYMVGVLICKGGAKKLVACSGKPTPGFRDAVKASGFILVGNGARTAAQRAEDQDSGTWECAARQLFENIDGHEPGQMTERWFAPHVRGVVSAAETPRVKVEFNVKGIDKVTRRKTQAFKYGQSVPSCSKCQKRLPKKVCGNECTEGK